MFNPTHFLTSNFNLMDTNSNWKILKKRGVFIDKNYNGLSLSLNKKNLNIYDSFHAIFYLDSFNVDQIILELKNLIQFIKKNKKKYFYLYLLNNFNENPIEKKIFDNLYSKLNINLDNLHIKIFDQNIRKLFSERNKVFVKFPFEIKFIDFISNEIKKNIIFFSSKPYKLIILDCDNTLWGGIIDEDGYEKIKYGGDGIGQIFQEFQSFLKGKKKQGFILTISSKNDEKKVWNTMKKRGMILQKKDFIIPKINWDDKAKNINQILSQLTLRANDSIFIDDNPLEIVKVKSQIKNINIVDSSNPLEILTKVQSDPRFFKHKILKEDLKKYKQYKLKSQFEDLSMRNDHSIQFYKKLKQKVIFENIKTKNFERTLQLFNKTNQFNFNLNRYTSLSLKKLLKNKFYSVKVVSFKDKFGDHGIIGAYIIKKEKLKIEIIDFVLSCRVLNRYLEDYIISKITQAYRNSAIFIFYKKEIINNVLIPIFLNKPFFKLSKKIKNLYKYNIKSTNNSDEIKKIFNN
jgi:FkbH-like protein